MAAPAPTVAALSAANRAWITAIRLAPRVISGGSTPSLAATGDGLTETRPGVYVFNDAQQWELGACTPEQIALTCHATVVSHAGGRLVLDSGSKVLGADRAPWASGFGRLLDHPDARIVILSEHHAVADLHGAPLPALGSVVSPGAVGVSVVGPAEVGSAVVVLLENKIGDLGTFLARVTGIDWFNTLGESVTIVTGLIFVVCVLAFRRGIMGELIAWLQGRGKS